MFAFTLSCWWRINICFSVSPSDDLSERRSSNSSLTSVTSRGSIMSPPEFNGAAANSTAANITTKMVSLKGRLSGAFSYWTGREKSPTQEKPCKLIFQVDIIFTCRLNGHMLFLILYLQILNLSSLGSLVYSYYDISKLE